MFLSNYQALPCKATALVTATCSQLSRLGKMHHGPSGTISHIGFKAHRSSIRFSAPGRLDFPRIVSLGIAPRRAFRSFSYHPV